MEIRNDVADRMDKIRTIFQHITEVVSEQPDDVLLISELQKTDLEFRSIAYEAAAMVRAIDDFSKGNTLTQWAAFAELTLPHAVQVHVGLGWAISKRKINASVLKGAVDPFMLPRVLDGSGYCDAMFRQRITIQNKEVPDHLDADLLRGYDQGVGRTLWYICKGNPNEVADLANSFVLSRQQDLWRGIGIAVTYVGGCTEEVLHALRNQAADCRNSLAIGTVLATISRSQAGTLNADTNLACQTLCKVPSSEIITIANKCSRTASSDYFNWVQLLEQQLSL